MRFYSVAFPRSTFITYLIIHLEEYCFALARESVRVLVFVCYVLVYKCICVLNLLSEGFFVYKKLIRLLT